MFKPIAWASVGILSVYCLYQGIVNPIEYVAPNCTFSGEVVSLSGEIYPSFGVTYKVEIDQNGTRKEYFVVNKEPNLLELLGKVRVGKNVSGDCTSISPFLDNILGSDQINN